MSAALTLHQIKVLTLYTTIGTAEKVPRYVVESALALCDVNIFSIQEALCDLIENEQLYELKDDDGTDYLSATETGKKVCELLKKDVPLSFREKALAFAAIELSKLRTQIGVEAETEEITRLEERYQICRLSLKDDGTELIGLQIYAPNKLQAASITERFRKNPLKIYQKILKILTGTDDEPDPPSET